MHIVLGSYSRAVISREMKVSLNGRVPGLREGTPNLSICIHAVKKAETGKPFPLGSPRDSQHRTEGRGDINLAKIGQGKSQEGLAR